MGECGWVWITVDQYKSVSASANGCPRLTTVPCHIPRWNSVLPPKLVSCLSFCHAQGFSKTVLSLGLVHRHVLGQCGKFVSINCLRSDMCQIISSKRNLSTELKWLIIFSYIIYFRWRRKKNAGNYFSAGLCSLHGKKWPGFLVSLVYLSSLWRFRKNLFLEEKCTLYTKTRITQATNLCSKSEIRCVKNNKLSTFRKQNKANIYFPPGFLFENDLRLMCLENHYDWLTLKLS